MIISKITRMAENINIVLISSGINPASPKMNTISNGKYTAPP
jgi:hypothetical protein